jgi:hypothetical protein
MVRRVNALLTKLLCDRYPLLFVNIYSPATQSILDHEFDFGDGWFDLIDVLCQQLQFWTDHNGAPQVVADRVKQKFGMLRFGCSSGNDETSGMVYVAEAMSARICEICGKLGKTEASTRRWLRTRSPEHARTKQVTGGPGDLVV